MSFGEFADPDRLQEWVKKRLKQRYPYVYLMFAGSQCDLSGMVAAYSAAKLKHSDRCFARLNEKNAANPDRCLYVGSSNAGYARFNQHLGLTAAKTYSLQLKTWATGLAGSISIDILEFRDEPDSKLLHFVEDALADKFKPIFGKRGSAR